MRLLSLLLILASVAAGDKPNVIVLLADDLGYADMSFLPQSPPDIATPNIDRLAKSGTYYKEAYATAPICSPSRVGLITGRYQQRWGNYWYGQGGLPDTETTIPQILKPLGYTTKKIGKTHNNGGNANHPLDHGFDEHLGFLHHTWDYLRISTKDAAAYNARSKNAAKAACIGPLVRNRDTPASFEDTYTTEVFADEAVEFLQRKHDKPFYLHLSFNAVHHPTYVNAPGLAKQFGAPQAPWNRDAKSWTYPFWDPNKEAWNTWHRKWGHLGQVDPHGRQRYLACLRGLDLAVGRVLDTLEKNDLRENTLVVFLSDNGGTINTYADNTPLRGYKYMFGEGGIRIPVILSWPGKLPTGGTTTGPVSSLDILPTIADLTGATKPANLDGHSLVPTFKGAAPAKKPLHWDSGKGEWVVRQGPWKLVQSKGWNHSNYQLDAKGKASTAPDYLYPEGLLLYNLEKDVGETTDLAAQNPEIVQTLTKLHDTWRAQMGKPVRGTRKNK